jgi:membrane dipeptidase
VIVVDGHLDIAFNHFCLGRDPRVSALEKRRLEGGAWKEKWRGKCMVGLPELRRGRVQVVFATVFVPRRKDWTPGDPDLAYETAEEAEKLGGQQIEFYRRLDAERDGFRCVASRADLHEVLAGWDGDAVGEVGVVLVMEGADPIRSPAAVSGWAERGVRIVGPAWKRTRYAGGTGEPGPLTAAGRDLVRALGEHGLILDLSHASEESFHEALDLWDGPVIASHSNPRALCPGDRQLTDAMIRRIAGRGGVIGAVPFNRMLAPDWRGPGDSVPMSRVAEAVHHVIQVAGTNAACAIGSDFDGGFGAESAPEGLDTVADLPRLADALSDLDFTDEAIYDILGRNWIRFLERSLPPG